VREITKRADDFARWYTDVVIKTELVDYGPVKGTMIIRPYGYEIWEIIRAELDRRIKAKGHKNAYFPLFIPKSFIDKEAKHIEGFAPELALVTHVGDEKLAEPLAVRPTSETVICFAFAKWLNSYKDLPILINQWANVVRMEKTTRPFLRTTEFLWQEGHTLHESQTEAEKHTLDMLEVYVDFFKEILAIDALYGQKTESEKFAGAHTSYTIETITQDGKALQSGTSHYLAQNFSVPFDIKYLSRANKHEYPHQTSWGVSTRMMGALIMAHSDDNGLVLPPNVAPLQVRVIPVASHKEGVKEKCAELVETLVKKGIRADADFSDNTPGFKFAQAEMLGIPIRIELGPKDIENGQFVLVKRIGGVCEKSIQQGDKGNKGKTEKDDKPKKEKKIIPLSKAATQVSKALKEVQNFLYTQNKNLLSKKTIEVDTLEKLGGAVESGQFAKTNWCGLNACEEVVKQKYAASARAIPLDIALDKKFKPKKACAICGKPAVTVVIFAKAY